jgi:2-oxoglutarate dehydrogenase E2 component (dihydrolipoamide succinyltransferase)
MAIDIVVPNLGESITEATVANWLKRPGDPVAADETVLELETDKATLEVPAPAAGVLKEIVVDDGEDVEVGARADRRRLRKSQPRPLPWPPPRAWILRASRPVEPTAA